MVDLQALLREVSDRRRAWEGATLQSVKSNSYHMYLLWLTAERCANLGNTKGVYDALQAINDIECNSTGDCTIAGDATEKLRETLGIEDV